MADDKLIFDLLTGQNTLVKDLSNVQKSVSSIEGNFKKLPQTVGNAFSGISKSIAVAGGAIGVAIVAVNKLIGTFAGAVHGAEEQEDAINRLNIALKASGDFTEAASLEFQAYASELQKVSRVGDEVTIANLALLKSLAPLTNEGLKAANTAATNLSAALRIDLDSAVRLVAKAANGNVEAFKRYGIELTKGKTDAETFAKALDAINTRFGGAAQGDINTFSGAIAQTGNAFSDVLEEVGGFITQNKSLIDGLKLTTEFFINLASAIKDYREELDNSEPGVLRQALIDLGVVADKVFIKPIQYLKEYTKEADNFGTANRNLTAKLPEVFGSTNVDQFTKDLSKASSAIGDTFKQAKKDGKDLLKNTGIDPIEFAKKSEEVIKKLQSDLKDAGQTQFEIITREAGERAALIKKYVKDTKLADQIINKNREDLLKKFKKAEDEAEKDRLERAVRRNQELANNPFADIGKLIPDIKLDPETQTAIATTVGAVNNLLKGTAGVAGLIGNLAGTMLNKLVEGLGQFAGPIISELAKGPESVSLMVKSFVDAIPTIVSNILLAIPELLISLFDSIGPFLEKLVEVIPVAIQKFVDKLPEIAVSLGEALVKAAFIFGAQMPMVANRMAISLAAQAPSIAVRFVDELIKETPRLITEMIKQFGKSVGGLGGSIGDVGGGLLGGIGDVLGSIGDVFGFADGGIVPGGSPFTDRVPALLTPGEQVIDRSLTQRLDQFLSGNTGGAQAQNLTVKLVIGEEQLANVLLNLNRNGFRVTA